MSEIVKRGYVGYEYREVSVPENLLSLYIDSYPCFGWDMDGNTIQRTRGKENAKYVDVRFKREVKIMNKAELTRLQRHFDDCVNQLEALERAKTSMPLIAALVVGLIGTAFMALATFAVTAQPPHVLACVLFAIPGFISWILPVFIYRRLVQAKKKKLSPLIDEKYNEIYDICEKGNRLLVY